MEEDRLKKMINCRLIESSWKIVEVSIYKAYTTLTNLNDAFDQSALASGSIKTLTNVSILTKKSSTEVNLQHHHINAWGAA